MSERQTAVGKSMNEAMRRIRFRRTRENLRFADEIRIIPRWLVGTVMVIWIATAITLVAINNHNPQVLDMTPGWGPFLDSLVTIAAVIGVGIPVAFFILLTGYVNRDAKRRGMSPTLWTLLVIALMSAWFAGYIIYFLFREPLPYSCPKCGSTVSARFNFCPHCKHNLHPACPQCGRDVTDSDVYCPHCGHDLAAGRADSHELAPGTESRI
jgi:hypothetical protein